MSENKKVLLVDDDPMLLKMYKKKLEIEGFEVESASDGEEGVKKAYEVIPSIILLDVMMPRMNGFEALKKLKSDSKTKDIPTILLTSLGSSEQDIKKGLSLGASLFLSKSKLTPSQVVEKIKDILAKN